MKQPWRKYDRSSGPGYLFLFILYAIHCMSAERGHPGGSYYEYLKGKTYKISTETGLSEELHIIFQTHLRQYGSRRIKAELSNQGYKASRHTIRKLFKIQGLKAIQPQRRFAAHIFEVH